jgi:hypothetical protein
VEVYDFGVKVMEANGGFSVKVTDVVAPSKSSERLTVFGVALVFT